jgi:hypothetical protein
LKAQKVAKLQGSKKGRESTSSETQDPNSKEKRGKRGGKGKFTSKEYIEDSDGSENSSIEGPVTSASGEADTDTEEDVSQREE